MRKEFAPADLFPRSGQKKNGNADPDFYSDASFQNAHKTDAADRRRGTRYTIRTPAEGYKNDPEKFLFSVRSGVIRLPRGHSSKNASNDRQEDNRSRFSDPAGRPGRYSTGNWGCRQAAE